MFYFVFFKDSSFISDDSSFTWNSGHYGVCSDSEWEYYLSQCSKSLKENCIDLGYGVYYDNETDYNKMLIYYNQIMVLETYRQEFLRLSNGKDTLISDPKKIFVKTTSTSNASYGYENVVFIIEGAYLQKEYENNATIISSDYPDYATTHSFKSIPAQTASDFFFLFVDNLRQIVENRVVNDYLDNLMYEILLEVSGGGTLVTIALPSANAVWALAATEDQYQALELLVENTAAFIKSS